MIRLLPDYLSVLKTLNAELPLFIFLTLLGARGYSIFYAGNIRREIHPIDRDILLLPEIVIESEDFNAKEELRYWFDSIWNACGFPGASNYDDA